MHFFMIVDAVGIIESVKLCDPQDLIHIGQPLAEIFGEESTKKILNSQNFTGDQNICTYITVKANMKNKIVPITIHSLYVEDHTLVLGFEAEAENQRITNEFVSLYNNFINQIRIEFKKSICQTEESVRGQFEEIQKLNNQLINTQRLLEKANAQLSAKNKELKSRLVKDALTGLVSRYQYWSEIEMMISQQPSKFGIFTFIDIDNFKFINDTYGHSVGDMFLIEFAKRLNQISLKNTIKIRIGGDEFALFTYGLDEVDQTTFQSIWDIIKIEVMDKPIHLSGVELIVSTSVGMAVYGIDTDSISKLIEYADFAMYNAKRGGKNRYCVFNKNLYELT